MEKVGLEMQKVSFTHRKLKGRCQGCLAGNPARSWGRMKSSEFGFIYVVSQVALTLLFLRQILLLT